MRSLIHKIVEYIWEPEHEGEFKKLKMLLSNTTEWSANSACVCSSDISTTKLPINRKGSHCNRIRLQEIPRFLLWAKVNCRDRPYTGDNFQETFTFGSSSTSTNIVWCDTIFANHELQEKCWFIHRRYLKPRLCAYGTMQTCKWEGNLRKTCLQPQMTTSFSSSHDTRFKTDDHTKFIKYLEFYELIGTLGHNFWSSCRKYMENGGICQISAGVFIKYNIFQLLIISIFLYVKFLWPTEFY